MRKPDARDEQLLARILRGYDLTAQEREGLIDVILQYREYVEYTAIQGMREQYKALEDEMAITVVKCVDALAANEPVKSTFDEGHAWAIFATQYVEKLVHTTKLDAIVIMADALTAEWRKRYGAKRGQDK